MVTPAGEHSSQPNLFHQISFVKWSHTVGMQHSYDSYSCKGLGLKVLGDGIRGPVRLILTTNCQLALLVFAEIVDRFNRGRMAGKWLHNVLAFIQHALKLQ